MLDATTGIDPATVQLRRADAEPSSAPLCAVRVPAGMRIAFRAPLPGPVMLAPAPLLGGKWYTPDPSGVWSGDGTLTVTLPPALVPPGPLKLELAIASYTSIGFYHGTQHMAATVNGRPIGQWVYTYGNTPPINVELPASDAFVLQMQVGPGMNPKQLGIGAEDQPMGMKLQWLMLTPLPR
jgi:hypothetical protein